MKKYMIRKIPLVLAMVVIGAFLFSGMFMLLWNSILPAVLHVSAITIWQAAGILVLSKLLFGGFRGRHSRWHARKYKMAECHTDEQYAPRRFTCHYYSTERP